MKIILDKNNAVTTAKVVKCSRILILFDGTDLSERAISYAKAMAKEKSIEVYLLYICEKNSIAQEKPWKYLWQKVDELNSKGISSSPNVVIGKVFDRIVEFVDNHSIDLIVVSIHEDSGIRQWIRGSVSRRLAHKTRIPLLLIKTSYEAIPVEQKKRWKILAPLDGSAFAETCLPYITNLFSELLGEIILLRVNESPEPPTHVTMDPFPEWDTYRTKSISRKREKLHRYLTLTGQRVRSKGVNVNLKLLSGEAADEIVKYAEQKDVDLIIMSTHENHGFIRAIWGSVSNKVIESATRPVLLIRPHLAKSSS